MINENLLSQISLVRGQLHQQTVAQRKTAGEANLYFFQQNIELR